MGMIMDFISNIGKPAKTLVDKGLIKESEFEYLFEGDDTFSVRPAKGLILVFNALTQLLCSVQFILIETPGGKKVYSGDLPSPFLLSMNKDNIRSLLGIPEQSSGLKTIPGIGPLGGYDMYLDRLSEYPGLQVRTMYTAELQVRTIAFDLIPPVS